MHLDSQVTDAAHYAWSPLAKPLDLGEVEVAVHVLNQFPQLDVLGLEPLDFVALAVNR